jgi:hypothetical protein
MPEIFAAGAFQGISAGVKVSGKIVKKSRKAVPMIWCDRAGIRVYPGKFQHGPVFLLFPGRKSAFVGRTITRPGSF